MTPLVISCICLPSDHSLAKISVPPHANAPLPSKYEEGLPSFGTCINFAFILVDTNNGFGALEIPNDVVLPEMMSTRNEGAGDTTAANASSNNVQQQRTQLSAFDVYLAFCYAMCLLANNS